MCGSIVERVIGRITPISCPPDAHDAMGYPCLAAALVRRSLKTAAAPRVSTNHPPPCVPLCRVIHLHHHPQTAHPHPLHALPKDRARSPPATTQTAAQSL